MAIVNSRPLTVDNLNSPDSLEPLTPNHLIQMKSSTALPPPGTFLKEVLYGAKIIALRAVSSTAVLVSMEKGISSQHHHKAALAFTEEKSSSG